MGEIKGVFDLSQFCFQYIWQTKKSCFSHNSEKSRLGRFGRPSKPSAPIDGSFGILRILRDSNSFSNQCVCVSRETTTKNNTIKHLSPSQRKLALLFSGLLFDWQCDFVLYQVHRFQNLVCLE